MVEITCGGLYQQRRGVKFYIAYATENGTWYGHDENGIAGGYYRDGRMATLPIEDELSAAEYDLIQRIPRFEVGEPVLLMPRRAPYVVLRAEIPVQNGSAVYDLAPTDGGAECQVTEYWLLPVMPSPWPRKGLDGSAAEVEQLRELLTVEKQKLELHHKWVADLQSGMYINCVYCGHRYGPKQKEPAQAMLAAHIAGCEKHPMYRYKQHADKTTDLLDRIRKLDLPTSEYGLRRLQLEIHNLHQEGLLL